MSADKWGEYIDENYDLKKLITKDQLHANPKEKCLKCKPCDYFAKKIISKVDKNNWKQYKIEKINESKPYPMKGKNVYQKKPFIVISIPNP